MSDKLDVLCMYEQPDEFSDMLEQRFPEVSFRYAKDADAVQAELETGGPDIAFEIPIATFASEAHAPIRHASNVKWLQLGSSGYEQFVPWDSERMVMTNAWGVLSPYQAELVTAAILALNAQLFTYHRQQMHKVWDMQGFLPVSDKTILIVGAGSIGALVAEKMKALGMHVIGIRGSGQPLPGFDEMHTPDALHALLPRVDVISVHARATAETQGLFDEQEFDLMKPGVIFANTARGSLVNEPALIHALTDGRVAAAYLDVFEVEPLPADSPLWELDNVLLTPHSADAVSDWAVRLARFFGDNLERWLNNEPLENLLTP